MAFPIKTCVICEEEFELRPDKAGFANRCPECSTEEARKASASSNFRSDDASSEMNAERRKVMKNMLYSKDS